MRDVVRVKEGVLTCRICNYLVSKAKNHWNGTTVDLCCYHKSTEWIDAGKCSVVKFNVIKIRLINEL